MIGRLTGTIVTKNQTPLIIDVHGVGYAVRVTRKNALLLKQDSTRTLYIHTHVREDALDLYGFQSQDELGLFELLITVSGVGPKTALSVIEQGFSAVEHAVMSADIDFFTTIPRLGKKNAQKIIIELKNKLGGLRDLDLTGESESETKQLLDALTGMGFERRHVIETIRSLPPEEKTETKLRIALKMLGKK